VQGAREAYKVLYASSTGVPNISNQFQEPKKKFFVSSEVSDKSWGWQRALAGMDP